MSASRRKRRHAGPARPGPHTREPGRPSPGRRGEVNPLPEIESFRRTYQAINAPALEIDTAEDLYDEEGSAMGEQDQPRPVSPPRTSQQLGAARRDRDRLDESDAPVAPDEPPLEDADEDVVTEASEQSFPASDPPARTGLRGP
ncbi:MAG: hypothetical protein AB1716_09835 [Planctomycetota bacterium]